MAYSALKLVICFLLEAWLVQSGVENMYLAHYRALRNLWSKPL